MNSLCANVLAGNIGQPNIQVWEKAYHGWGQQHCGRPDSIEVVEQQGYYRFKKTVFVFGQFLRLRIHLQSVT